MGSVYLPNSCSPSPREFGRRLISMGSSTVRIYEERGSSLLVSKKMLGTTKFLACHCAMIRLGGEAYPTWGLLIQLAAMFISYSYRSQS